MNYKVGDKFYKISANGSLIILEIDYLSYHLKGGTINNNKYINDKQINKLLEEKRIYTSDEEYKQMKINQKKLEIEKLVKDIEKLERN